MQGGGVIWHEGMDRCYIPFGGRGSERSYMVDTTVMHARVPPVGAALSRMLRSHPACCADLHSLSWLQPSRLLPPFVSPLPPWSLPLPPSGISLPPSRRALPLPSPPSPPPSFRSALASASDGGAAASSSGMHLGERRLLE